MTTYIPIFSEGYWGILTTPGSEAYHALWAPLLVFEITGNFIFLVSSIILLVLFFQKHYRFPRLMIVYLAANLVFVGTDFFLADLIPAVAAESDPESIRELIRTIIGAAIWIPYFCSSVRVKNTFTKGLIEQNVGHNAIYASGVERQSLARMSQLHVLENLKTLLTTLLLAMGIFSSLFGANSNEEYKTAKQYEKNRLSQIAMTPETMDQLRKYGVTDSSMPRLEYFFSTNTEEKAASLFEELQRLGYVGEFDKSANNSKGYVITGWTTKMAMDDKTVADWTALMCDLGKENDCDFDGWGTNPNQENEQVRTDRQRATPVNRPFEVQPNPGVPHLSVRTKA